MQFPYSDPSPDAAPFDADYPLARPLRLPANTGSFVILGGEVRLVGWSLRETTSIASARIDFYSGSNNTGILIATISLAPGESIRDWLPPYGIGADGMAAVVTTGSVDGSVWVIPQ